VLQYMRSFSRISSYVEEFKDMNSSMLNSEEWDRSASPSSYRLVWHITLFVGAVCLVVGNSLFLQWLYPNKSQIPRSKPNYAGVEVLFLGNSQLRNIDTSTFPRRSLNAALAGSDYSIKYALLRALAPRMPDLRLLVLGFDNVPLQTSGIRNRKGDYKQLIKAGIPWWDIPDTSALEQFLYFISYNRLLQPLLVGPKLDIDQLQKHAHFQVVRGDAKSNDTNAQETKGLPDDMARSHIRPGFSYAPEDGAKKIDMYVRLRQQDNNLIGNRKAFGKMMGYCAAHEIQPVLLRAPTTNAFWEKRPPDWEEELRDLMSLAQEQFKGEIPLWDEEHSGAYPLEDFDDPNHLTRDTGKALFSARLNDLINAFFAAQAASKGARGETSDGAREPAM